MYKINPVREGARKARGTNHRNLCLISPFRMTSFDFVANTNTSKDAHVVFFPSGCISFEIFFSPLESKEQNGGGWDFPF